MGEADGALVVDDCSTERVSSGPIGIGGWMVQTPPRNPACTVMMILRTKLGTKLGANSCQISVIAGHNISIGDNNGSVRRLFDALGAYLV